MDGKTYEQVAEEIKSGKAHFGSVIASLRKMTGGKVSRDFEGHCLVALGIDKQKAFGPRPMGNAAFKIIADWISDSSEEWEKDGVLRFDNIRIGFWKVNE